MKAIILLLLVPAALWSQQNPQQTALKFNAIAKVEDKEKFYNELISSTPSSASQADQYDQYRGQLAVDWLIEGDIEKYKFYKNTNPRFTALQLFEISNQLEYWVDDNKNIAAVEQISRQLLDELAKKMYQDPFSRTGILWEINAMANARLGNVDLAMKNIKKSSETDMFRNFPYFRNTKANYLNRYAAILSAAGQHQRALDTLTKAAREANSNKWLIATLKEVYPKVHGSTSGMDKYIQSLQDEAYHKVYKEVEKSWAAKPVAAPDLAMLAMNGEKTKLSDYRGKIVVIDFWSTTCKPCVAAFPAFERAVAAYRNEPFKLFVLNAGEEREEVKLYMDKKGYNLDVLFDIDETMFKALNALGTPQKFIIDPKGNIHLTGIGYAGSDDKEFYKLKAMIELTKARSI